MSVSDRINQCLKALGINQSELSARCGWEDVSRLNNYINRKRALKLETIKKIADALNCSAAWLAFGDGEPPHYLSLERLPKCYYPLISKEEFIKAIKENKEILFDTTIELISLNTLNRHCYVISIYDDSMSSNQDYKITFQRGDLIIIDPEKNEPKHQDFVIAYQEGWEEPVFAQYNKIGEDKFLKFLIDGHRINMTDSIKIIGTAVVRLNFLM